MGCRVGHSAGDSQLESLPACAFWVKKGPQGCLSSLIIGVSQIRVAEADAQVAQLIVGWLAQKGVGVNSGNIFKDRVP